MKRSVLRVLFPAALATVFACGETTPPPEVTTITVTSGASTNVIMLGQTLQLSAQALDQNGSAMPAVTSFTWSSDNLAVATVDANGLVTAKGGGEATISATSGAVSGVFELEVEGSLHSEDVTTSQTWRAVDSPHLVTKWISVTGSASPVLTIEPGATLRFASGAGLTIGGAAAGSIIADGTVTAPISMVADAATPAKGFWVGIEFESNAGPSALRFVTLSHCGGDATQLAACVFMEGSNVKPVMANVTINNSGRHGVVARNGAAFGTGSTTLTVTNANAYPVHIAPNEAGTIPAGGSFTGNTSNAVFLSASRVETTQTWPNLAIPYVASVDVLIEASGGPVLTLLPGTEIRHDPGREFAVGTCGSGGPGTLIAVGTAAQPIKFTANSASPSAGSWDGLYIGCTASANTRVEHAIVEYGGENSLYAAFTGNILVEQDIGPIVKNTVIRFSKDCGIIRRTPLSAWTTDFTAAALGNTFTGNVRTQCGP